MPHGQKLPGLSPADMAMHVVLPEVDGRIFAGVASFKESEEMDEAFAIRTCRSST